MKARTVLAIAANSTVFLALVGNLTGRVLLQAQQPKVHTKTFSGPNDKDFPYPIVEGVTGHKDSTAILLVEKASASGLIPEQVCLEGTGVMTRGLGTDQQQFPATFHIENEGRFRMDVEQPDGPRSVRLTKSDAKAKVGYRPAEGVADNEFGDPLAIPFFLAEVVRRKDTTVVDDGIVIISEHPMQKLTITLPRHEYGGSVSASFYFDGDTHLLEKAAFINHSSTNRSLAFLKVVTYSDYRKESSGVVPHKYVETINGQLVLNLEVTGTQISPLHPDSYFAF